MDGGRNQVSTRLMELQCRLRQPFVLFCFFSATFVTERFVPLCIVHIFIAIFMEDYQPITIPSAWKVCSLVIDIIDRYFFFRVQ